MFPHCSKNQRDKNGQGKINRVNTFYPLRSYSDEDEDGNPITFETFKT